MTARRLRTPDERAAAHRRRRRTIDAKRADAYQRQREREAQRSGQLGLGLAGKPDQAGQVSHARDLVLD